MSDEQGQLVDRREYGRRARAARIIAGFDSVKDAVDAVEQRTGVRISARQMYAIERGEVPLQIDWYFALSMAYEPPGGLAYWEPCMSDQLREMIYRRIEQRVSGAMS